VNAALVVAACYLVGSIPFSFLVARYWGVTDVRRVGSGNVGATNVMRSAGAVPGALALLLDVAKGVAAVLAVARLGGLDLAGLAAASAVVGHTYPLWLGFRGGKGVATGAGAFLPLAPVATAVGLLVFAVTLAATRYVSAGSVAGSLALAVAAFLTGQPPGVAWAAAGVALLVVWKHRGNLARIAGGTESRLGRPGRPGRERQAG
jgi:glycerol-3-phosphate acyltransferase PlsY